jgi:hypothetical protein
VPLAFEVSPGSAVDVRRSSPYLCQQGFQRCALILPTFHDAVGPGKPGGHT